jgi:hypothetical protein
VPGVRATIASNRLTMPYTPLRSAANEVGVVEDAAAEALV